MFLWAASFFWDGKFPRKLNPQNSGVNPVVVLPWLSWCSFAVPAGWLVGWPLLFPSSTDGIDGKLHSLIQAADCQQPWWAGPCGGWREWEFAGSWNEGYYLICFLVSQSIFVLSWLFSDDYAHSSISRWWQHFTSDGIVLCNSLLPKVCQK